MAHRFRFRLAFLGSAAVTLFPTVHRLGTGGL